MSIEIIKYWVWGDDFVCNTANLKVPIKNSKLYNGEQFISPKYNPITDTVYESATEEEIAEANKVLVPSEVKNMKFRLALIKNGISVNQISQTINAMPESVQKEQIQTLWEYADFFGRTDKTLNAMALQFNISENQLDQLFILANTL